MRSLLKLLIPTLVLFVIGFATLAWAQEAPPLEDKLDLMPYIQQILLAVIPGIAYVAVFFVAKLKDKIPVFVLPLIPPALAYAITYVQGLQDSAASAFVAIAWGGLATVIHEVQKQIAKWASGGQARSILQLVKNGRRAA